MFLFNEYKKVIPINFSASLSFYLVLGLVPSFLLIYIFSFYFLNDLNIIFEIINLLFPYEYSNELIIFLNSHSLDFNIYLFILVFICLNIISNGISNLSRSIDYIFNFKSKNNIRIKSILISLLLVLLEGMMLFIASFINYYFNVFSYLRFLIIFIIILFSLLFIFKFIPSGNFKLKDIISIIIIFSFVISIVIVGFNIFIDYYSNIDRYYGPLNIIVSILILFKFISDIISIVLYFVYKKMLVN